MYAKKIHFKFECILHKKMYVKMAVVYATMQKIQQIRFKKYAEKMQSRGRVCQGS